MSFPVITVSNRWPKEHYYCSKEFLRSCDRHSIAPIILGQGNGEYRGLASKPKLLKKFLESGEYTNKYVVFCDSWDLVFGNPNFRFKPNMLYPEIIERFKSFEAPWVCSGELNLFPHEEAVKEYFDINVGSSFRYLNGGFRYLNSGFIVAETAAMVAVLDHMDLGSVSDDHVDSAGRRVCPNDQQLFQVVFTQRPVPMKIDFEAMICLTMCGVDLNVSQNSYAFDALAVHWNGGSKTEGSMQPMLKELGL